ncbi:synaptonemal complex protein 2-like [Pagrus major]|uniref:synaptonemal complex protein 2-like n=1 Tax=Pagrus major TaxID=143350 RepID=UPI003CC8CEA5
MMEVRVEDCLLRGDSSDLVYVLRHEGLSSITLTRLHQLVTKGLCGPDGLSRLLVVLKSLETLSDNRDDLQTLIGLGLTAKVLLWFEAVHDLMTSDLQKISAPLLRLTEAFYDYFLLLGQASLPVSQLSVVLLYLARFALEPEIYFPLRLEAIRTFNIILDSLSSDQRRLIQKNQNQIQTLSQMAAAVLTAGDYRLQASLAEALCRLTTRKERQHRANQWFSSRDISTAFCDITLRDFEVDCRCFLNIVNGSHGDQRRVYSFSCLRAFLDSTELFPPKDDKLEKFWIDFNLSSRCVHFFIDNPQGFLWVSVHLQREDVDHYSVQLKPDGCTGAEMVLTVHMNKPIVHHNSRGQTVKLNFDPEHHRELEEAAGRVFMAVRSPPCVDHTGGTVQVSPTAGRHNRRSYSRKKPQSKSQLKILPLSSPSSDEDSSVMKAQQRHSAEFLFDRIRTSTPSYDSGAPVGAELNMSQEQTGGSSSPLLKEVVGPDRKRAAPDSGYLSDQTEGVSGHKRRAGPEQEGEESNAPLAEGSPERAEPPEQEDGAESGARKKEPESDLTSGITAAFNAFKTQLEQHFTGCWRNASSLLTAVHQHRLVLLQRFESSVTDQLTQLQETSTSLNSINTQILSFFQSEMQRLGSFCDEHLQRLKSLDREELGREHPSSQ